MAREYDPVRTELENARIRLVIEMPILGAVILHLELKEVDWCPTAATDGRYFYYNRDFIKKLNKGQILFLTAHEVLHCILEHMSSRGNLNRDLWNMAADYIVNWLLYNWGELGKKIGEEPTKDILYDSDYDDSMTTIELYYLLKKKQVKIKQPMDMHLECTGDDLDGKDKRKGKGFPGDGPPIYTADEIETIRNNLQSSLIQAAQQQNNINPGSIPLGLQRLLDQLLEPKVDWRQMLDVVLRSSIKYDYTYTRKSRRSYSNGGLILPGRNVMDKVEAFAWLDGSGSTTTKMVTDFLSECKGIMSTFRDYVLTIGTFDTEVYNIVTYTPDNCDDIDNYEFKGGGGTRPSACWDYMKKNDIVPHRVILFTDGEVGDDWGEEDYCDTLFIIHSNPKVKASYGLSVHYESE